LRVDFVICTRPFPKTSQAYCRASVRADRRVPFEKASALRRRHSDRPPREALTVNNPKARSFEIGEIRNVLLTEKTFVIDPVVNRFVSYLPLRDNLLDLLNRSLSYGPASTPKIQLQLPNIRTSAASLVAHIARYETATHPHPSTVLDRAWAPRSGGRKGRGERMVPPDRTKEEEKGSKRPIVS
jgi:hypothetical protein